jgi:hypothetical protein
MLFTGDFKLARAVALDPMLDPGEPGVQLLEERLGLCPVQHDHNGGVWKSGL